MNVQQIIKDLIKNNNIMTFTKSYCPYCTKVKDLFTSLNVKFHYEDMDKLENGAEMQEELYKMTQQKTVPNVFIKGKHVGGCDKVMELQTKGELLKMIQ